MLKSDEELIRKTLAAIEHCEKWDGSMVSDEALTKPTEEEEDAYLYAQGFIGAWLRLLVDEVDRLRERVKELERIRESFYD